ncbi:MAG: peptidoglycan DD-metalloendopeptidase family protein [Deltaproteobacteria bacterium]|nr:peptidoglycan DD-metalloendopeptidase family protein [Deltaproteobacteria bacterium]
MALSDRRWPKFRQLKKPNRLPLLLLISLIAVTVLLIRQYDLEGHLTGTESEPLIRPSPPPTTCAEGESPPRPEEKKTVAEELCGVIKRGDTLSSLLGEYFNAHNLWRLAQDCEKIFPVRGLCVGQPYTLKLENGSFKCFIYEIDAEEQLLIGYANDRFAISKEAIAYQVERHVVVGTIEESLFQTVAQLGEGTDLACRLADIFAWDIDFARDLRQHDSFRVLVEKRYRDGVFAGYGALLAAEFVNQGDSYRAVAFPVDGEPAAFYDSNGRSLKKTFLKAPLAYSRISSGYSNRRLHPVLNVWRPHRAVDYAAPAGTPVMAVAGGVVVQRSYDKSNGNKVRLRHPNHYETSYIHLSRFACGIRVGSKVSQGQVIGYVGATGLATGPHLDFRAFKNGRPINPLKIERIPSSPLTEPYLSEFKLKAQEYFAFIDQQTASSACNR